MVPHIGDDGRVDARRRPQQPAEPDADERRQIAACHLRRLIDRAVLRRQPRQRQPRSYVVDLAIEIGGRLHGHRLRVAAQRAFEIAAPLENLADLRQRPRIGAIELDRLPKMLQREILLPLLPLDGRELAIKKRTLRRARERGGVGLKRFVETAGARRLPGARDLLLADAERQHVDAPPHLRLARIDGEHGLERRQRLAVPVHRQQRLTAADQRRQILLLLLDDAIEVRQRGLRLLARELQVAERGLSRIERGRVSERGIELVLRRLQVPVLQKRPAARLVDRRRTAGERRRHDRHHEIGKLRRRHDRRRHDFRRARADQHQRRHQQPSHRTNSS